jgi:hypothetical protein
MGTLTLKQLCDAAREELGWSRPSAYADTSDDDGLQTFRIANRQGRDLADQAHPWEELKTEGTITLVDGAQAYALPADFRYLIPSTVWDSNAERIAIGPLTAFEWSRSQNSGTIFGLNWRYEVRSGDFVIDQTVTSGDAGTVLSYEYISSYWARTSGGTAKLRFSADDDTQRFDDDLFIEGMIWRLKKVKGFDWEQDFAMYQNQLARVLSRDGGMRDIVMRERANLGANIPERNYG